MKKDHMQKVKQKVPKDKSHLDPGQAKLLEIALIFWRYELFKISSQMPFRNIQCVTYIMLRREVQSKVDGPNIQKWTFSRG